MIFLLRMVIQDGGDDIIHAINQWKNNRLSLKRIWEKDGITSSYLYHQRISSVECNELVPKIIGSVLVLMKVGSYLYFDDG